MGRYTFTLDKEQQAAADQMAADKGLSVKDCLFGLLAGSLAQYEQIVADQKWAAATPEQKKAAMKTLGKGTKKKAAKKN